MSEAGIANSQSPAVATPAEARREPAQVTLSTIGDISVATSEALEAIAQPPKETRWKLLLALFFAVYVFSVGFAWLLSETRPWVQVLLAPLFPVLCATAAFWWRQKWKFRARDWQFKLKIWQDALDSVAHEGVNAVNAIRANLIGFRLANPQVSYPEHLEILEEEARRIDAVIQKSRDPVAWKGRKKKKQEAATPTSVGEDTRSRIAL